MEVSTDLDHVSSSFSYYPTLALVLRIEWGGVSLFSFLEILRSSPEIFFHFSSKVSRGQTQPFLIV